MNEEFLKALREQDANLRDAIQQDEMELPKMPADLNARLMQRMGAQPQKSRIRQLWPWLAAACVAAFLIVLVAPPKDTPTGEPKVTAKVEQPATTEVQKSEPEAEAPQEADTQKTIESPAKSPRQLPKPSRKAITAAEPLLAQTSPAETAQPAVEETDLTATAVAQASSETMTTLTERDIPITRPENYQYTPEELALLKKQANEAYLKWVELELEISKCNLEQTASK
jgi:outer membrane biosynthesis protein TonB